MKWIWISLCFIQLTACVWFHPGVVRDRDVLVTEKPNRLLEPFTCGDVSIDVTTTVRTCK
ncbi:hypothetical protein [Legionella impletisoli]|uniref:Lipoprotein n=1 Tax=Legionella impletisoli TaxID=343510 RepID=A0A917JVR4_9GAMM|nr:hypothetical protein [Legionella impletisoli]GGI88417.1 hypothetical protein GCM10007966_16480 [Legionella impletisoli]